MNLLTFVGPLIILLVVSFLDLKYRKISNYWSLLNILLFVIFVGLSFTDYQETWTGALYYPAMILAGGYLLFLLSIAGGGDVKFSSSFFLIVPSIFHANFFLLVLYMTILISLSNLTINFFSNFFEIIVLLKLKTFGKLSKYWQNKFPFAPVLLFAWMLWGWINREKIYFPN